MNIDIETLYSRKVNLAIEIASSYTNEKRLPLLIKTGRLKPYQIFIGEFKKDRLANWWVDEFGNSLLIKSNKLSVRLTDPDIKEEVSRKTDLFGLRSIVETMKISKSLILVDDLLLFYGRDEYFRCFYKISRERASVLEVRLEVLMQIFDCLDSRYKKTDEFLLYRLPERDIEMVIEKEYGNE